MKTVENLIKDYQDLGLRLEVAEDSLKRPVARLYKKTPKAKYTSEKLLWGYYFKSDEQRLEYINKDLDNRLKSIKEKEQRKIERKLLNDKQRDDVQVGDIFCYSWGWEQTNVDFYQVIAKPSKSKIIIKEINYKTLETTSWASENVRPVKDSFINDNEEKVTLSGKYFNRSCGCAVKVDNPETSSHYRSWYA